MWIVFVSITFIMCTSTGALFIGQKYYPKCCDYGKIISKFAENILTCENGDNNIKWSITSLVLSSPNKNESFGSFDCVDLNENSEFVKIPTTDRHQIMSSGIFYKCCPPDQFYSKVHRRCFFHNTTHSFEEMYYLRVGMSHCIHPNIIEDISVPEEDVSIRSKGIFVKNYGFFEDGFWCVDEDAFSEEIVVRKCGGIEECRARKKCLRKCCPDGEYFFGTSVCFQDFNEGIDYEKIPELKSLTSDNFAIIHGSNCTKYVAHSGINFTIDATGNLLLNGQIHPPNEESYCIEHTDSKKYKGDYVFLCATKRIMHEKKFVVTRIVLIISCVCLILTILAYLFGFERVNLFGKTLVSFCSSLLVAFLLLTYLMWAPQIGTYCTEYGFALLYFTFAIFFWMNVMCFDIWWTFGSPKCMMNVTQRRKETKRFIWYSIYGWGVPVLLTLIIFAATKISALPMYLRPQIGENKCMIYSIKGNYGRLIFFLTPLSIIKLCDTILFIKTVVYCLKVRGEITKMNDTLEDSHDRKKWFTSAKERLSLLVKLFVVMGISWLFEVITTIYRSEDSQVFVYTEYVWDIINCLQGVFIFLIFVCKPKVFQNFRKKFGTKKLRRGSITSTMTQSSALLNKSAVTQNIKLQTR